MSEARTDPPRAQDSTQQPGTTASGSRAFQRPPTAAEDAAELDRLAAQLRDLDGITEVHPVSATKNYVLRGHVDDLGVCYLKSARTEDGMTYQIGVEKRMWDEVWPGSTRVLQLPGGRYVTAIRSAGHEPAHLDASLARPLAIGLRRLHRIPFAPFADLEVQTVNRTREYLARRLDPLTDPVSCATAKLARDLLHGLPDTSPVPNVVVHGDTTMLNFVLFDRDDHIVRAAWIDLETAVLAPPEWDYTAFWVAAMMEGLPDLAAAFLAEVSSVDATGYDWSIRQILASKLAWSAWRTSKGNATYREDLPKLTALAVSHLETP